MFHNHREFSDRIMDRSFEQLWRCPAGMSCEHDDYSSSIASLWNDHQLSRLRRSNNRDAGCRSIPEVEEKLSQSSWLDIALMRLCSACSQDWAEDRSLRDPTLASVTLPWLSCIPHFIGWRFYDELAPSHGRATVSLRNHADYGILRQSKACK